MVFNCMCSEESQILHRESHYFTVSSNSGHFTNLLHQYPLVKGQRECFLPVLVLVQQPVLSDWRKQSRLGKGRRAGKLASFQIKTRCQRLVSASSKLIKKQHCQKIMNPLLLEDHFICFAFKMELNKNHGVSHIGRDLRRTSGSVLIRKHFPSIILIQHFKILSYSMS